MENFLILVSRRENSSKTPKVATSIVDTTIFLWQNSPAHPMLGEGISTKNKNLFRRLIMAAL